MLRLLSAAQVPPLGGPILAGLFIGRVGGGALQDGSTTPAGRARQGTRCLHEPGGQGVQLRPESQAREIRRPGRVWPQPDPISKEFESQPFVQVFVR